MRIEQAEVPNPFFISIPEQKKEYDFEMIRNADNGLYSVAVRIIKYVEETNPDGLALTYLGMSRKTVCLTKCQAVQIHDQGGGVIVLKEDLFSCVKEHFLLISKSGVTHIKDNGVTVSLFLNCNFVLMSGSPCQYYVIPTETKRDIMF